MAIDLSSIIKDTIYSTLEITLSNEIKQNEIFTCNQDCLNGKNVVSIGSTFTFDKLTTNINFIYPAYFASYTFNTMMMEDSEPLLEIDDDIADALKEVTAQISGSLETAINANTDDTLGSCKFSSGEVNIELGDNYSDVSNLIMLTFNSNNKDFEIFLNFDDEISPYIDELLSNDLKITEIAPLVEEKTEDKDTDEKSDDNNEEASSQNESNDNEDETADEEIQNKPLDNETIENEPNDNQNEEIDENLEKEKKLKKIIIAIAALLVLVLIGFATLFFMGSFDAPIIIKDKNTTKPSPQDLILANIKNKHIIYKEDMININKLNKRLAILTKYEILETDILNNYKKNEKERLYKLKMKSLEEFATKNKEEKLFVKGLNTSVKNKNRFTNDSNNSSKIKYNNDNEILSLIKIDALVYNMYSKIINNEKTKSTAISMCKDKYGKTNVYIGPLYINTLINNIVKKVGKKDAKLIRVKRKEFNKMCDF